jgi:hypothetical protein
VIEIAISRQAEQSKKGHRSISPRWTSKGTHRPSQQERWNEATQGSDAADNTNRGARLFRKHERNDLEDATVAKSRSRADDEDDGKKPCEAVGLEKCR